MKRLFSTQRGLLDFILQRLSAVILAVYVIHLIVVGVLLDELTYETVSAYFTSPYTMLLTTLVIVAIVIHGWIGMWTVGTDYIRTSSIGAAADSIRQIYQFVVAVALLAYLGWALWLVWT